MTKKLLIKKTIFALLAASILLTTIPTAYGAAVQTPTIKVDGQTVIFPDAVPFVDSNDRTMVPVRFVAETLGAEVSWESTRQLVTIVKDTTRIALRIGENSAVVNTPTSDARKEFDTVSVLKESRTFVPLRFISETFGASVTWDGANNTVIINSDGTVATVECTGECKPVEPTTLPVAVENKTGLSAEDIARLKQIPYSQHSNGGWDGTILRDGSQTNEQLMASRGIDQINQAIATAKGYMETRFNVDYTTMGNEFKEDLRPYLDRTNYDRYISSITKVIVDYKQVLTCEYFYSDPSLVYIDKSGLLCVRGIRKIYLTSCLDPEKAFGKGVVVGKWLEQDVDIRLGLQTGGAFTGWGYAAAYDIATARVVGDK